MAAIERRESAGLDDVRSDMAGSAAFAAVAMLYVSVVVSVWSAYSRGRCSCVYG